MLSSSPSLPAPPAMLMVGVVSMTTVRFRIVPVAELVPRLAPEAFDNVTVNVSSLSFSSSAIDTDTVLLVSPASKVRVPLLAV